MKSTKPKKRKVKESSNNQGLPVIILLVVGAVGYFSYDKITKETQKAGIEETQTANVKKKRNAEPEPIEYPESSPYSASGGLKEEKADESEQPQENNGEDAEKVEGVQAEITKKVEERKRQQEVVRNNFKSLLQVDINLPKNLHYAELDLDEGLAGIRGTGSGDVRDFSILGTKKKVSAQLATAFLNESNSGVPTSQGARFTGKSKIKVKVPPGKGISKIEVIDSSNPNVKAALISRADGKGSYLFVLKGQSGFFENNEGFLDNMLKNFQAK